MKRSTLLSLSTIFLSIASASYLSQGFAKEYSHPPFSQYMPDSAIYITVGGGVTWMENDDWYRNPSPTNVVTFQVMQPSDSENVVGMVNAAIGYQFHILPIRAEVAYHWYDTATYDWRPLYKEASAPTSPAGQGTIESQSVLFNIYYDWYNTTRLTPFIGAGIGYYHNHSEFSVFAGNRSPSSGVFEPNNNHGLAWGASAGVKYEITSNWLVDIRADYTDLGFVQIYEFAGNDRQALMKNDDFYAITAMANLTYAYNFLD